MLADNALTHMPFGTPGNIARGMLLPSLYGLDSDEVLPADLRIVGTVRTESPGQPPPDAAPAGSCSC